MVDFKKVLHNRTEECNEAVLQMRLNLEARKAAQIAEIAPDPDPDPEHDDFANRVNPYPTQSEEIAFSDYCKLDSRTGSATLIHFDNLCNVTKEGNTSAGAILIEINCTDYWIPKTLCSNLDLEANTVYIWTKFLEESKPELLEIAEERKEDNSNG